MEYRNLIKIDYSASDRKIVRFPSETRVPKGSIVSWDISILSFDNRSIGRSLLFVIYFPKTSPFSWLANSLLIDPYNISQKIFNSWQFKNSIASEVGDYKYGIRVTDPQTNNLLDDEDPYLIVF